MEQFPWTESGKQLLAAINSYIEQHGGRFSLANEIVNEERKARESKWRECHQHKNSSKKTRRVRFIKLTNGRKEKLFDNVKLAAKFLKTQPNNIQSAVYAKCRVKNWYAEYIICN